MEKKAATGSGMIGMKGKGLFGVEFGILFLESSNGEREERESICWKQSSCREVGEDRHSPAPLGRV